MLGVAHAAERNPLESKLIVDAGWFFMSTDTRVRVDGQTSDEIGTDVDYDDTFGLGDFDRFRGEVSWRIAPRHLIRGMYFQNNRTGTRVLNQDVEFSGETYPVGATVDARSDLKIAQLSYEYAFLRRESYEIAGGIGIHYMDMGLQLDATVISQGTTVSRSLAEEATTKAPLPVLGLRGLWVLPNNFYVSAQAQYFHLNFDPYTGSLLDLKASIVWQASDHVGFGIAYNDFGFKFDIDEQGANDFNGHLRWDYSGAVAFATFMF
jgi:hypothetical protein